MEEEIEEFNFQNASNFLDECVKQGLKPDSTRQVVIRLAPKIRQMMAAGYTQRQIYELLIEKFRLELGFAAFRNYLSAADRAKNSGKN